MGGILTLHLSIVQTSLRSIVNPLPIAPTPEQLLSIIIPPLRLSSAWTWLSNILKDPLVSAPPAAHLITTWIQIVGPEVIKVYGERQVGKAMEVIWREAYEGGKVRGNVESERQKMGLAVEKWKEIGFSPARDWRRD
jgi:hypothetical protein